MSLFELDYNILSNIGKKTYKLSEVKDRLIKVAFDIVRFRDEPEDELWQVVQDAQDGDYIVARYNEDESPPIKQASTKKWESFARDGEVYLFYKGTSFTKFAHSDAESVVNFLPTKLSNDQQFVDALLASLSSERQSEIKNLYPELF